MKPQLKPIIHAHYDRAVNSVVHRLRRIATRDWGGDDEVVRNVWDWWKLEHQQGESELHNALEDTIEAVIETFLASLPDDEVQLLAMATIESDDDESSASNQLDAVGTEMMDRLNCRATNEPHARRVQRMLDALEEDRSERELGPWI